MKAIRYKEIYPFRYVTSETTGVRYKDIDFNNKITTIYNRDFDLSREGNLAIITQLPTGEVWNHDEATDSPVFKKEYLNGISEEPKVDVDIELDRGSASAFERHFKLLECNTMEDLENQGNNIFNL
jgi:hypothetical protein